MAKRLKSGIKRTQIGERNRQQNMAVKSRIKTAIRKLEDSMVSKDDKLTDNFKAAVSNLDKAVTKGVIHKNKAARKKSRIAQKVNALKV